MWNRNDQPPRYFVEDDDDERYPFYPVDHGHPVVAVMCLVCAVGLILVLALVRP